MASVLAPVQRARCRCGVDLTVPSGCRVWQPRRDRPPDPTVAGAVRSVAILGMDPLRMRAARTGSGWARHGAGVRLEMVPWCAVGLCWAGHCHLVVDTASVRR